MAEMWYYTSEGKQMDAVSIKELKKLVGEGVLKPTDMVWKDGMARWIRASSVKELFPEPTSELDRFFTSSAEVPRREPVASPIAPAAPTSSSAMEPAVDKKPMPAPETEEPREQKRRRASGDDAEEDRRRPPRRRAEAESGGGSMGIVIFLLLGGAVLLFALCGGVIILIYAFQPNPNPPPRPRGEFNQNPIPAGGKLIQEFQVNLRAGANEPRVFRFQKGATYQISVRSAWDGGGERPDVNLIVFRGGAPQVAAQEKGPDCDVTFEPPEDGEYTVEVRNRSRNLQVQAKVVIRQTKDPVGGNNPGKEDPLPAGVREGSGVFDTEKPIAPRTTTRVKFRVRGGHAAKITVSTREARANPGVTVSVTRDKPGPMIFTNRTGRTVPVTFNLPNTEIVVVNIRNASAVPTTCTIVYDVSPK